MILEFTTLAPVLVAAAAALMLARFVAASYGTTSRRAAVQPANMSVGGLEQILPRPPVMRYAPRVRRVGALVSA